MRYSELTKFVDADFDDYEYCPMNTILGQAIMVTKVRFHEPVDDKPEGVKFAFIRPLNPDEDAPVQCTFTRSGPVVKAMHRIYDACKDEQDESGTALLPAVECKIIAVKGASGRTYYNITDA